MKQLLVGHLRRDRLAVEAAALGEEEVAGVDDLLHLAERLAYGLPISRVTSRDSASLLSSTSRPMFLITPPRTGAGTRAHSRCARRAARQAAAKPSASASRTLATTSSRCAGLRDSTRRPVSATVAMLRSVRLS